MKRFLTFAAILSLLVTPLKLEAQTPSKRKAEIPKEELNILNKTIKAADVYKHDKATHLDTLKRNAEAQPLNSLRQWELISQLADEYLPLRADSSMVYAERALRIAEANDWQPQIYVSRIANIKALATSGIFIPALQQFEQIDKASLTGNEKILYFEAGRRLYGYMRAMVETEKRYYNSYTEKYLQFNDSLAAALPENSDLRQFLTAEQLINTGHNLDAKPILERLMEKLEVEDNIYGMAAFQLATVYSHIGDDREYATYLAKAAVSDIKGCINDGLALPSLAYWMYEQGELNEAFRYINYALQDATAGNARIRTITIASLLPIIDEAYRDKISASRDELMIYFLLVTFLLIISGVLVTILMRQIKRSRKASAKLSKTSRLQENYIGHFIELCSTYAKRMQLFSKTVSRKIAAGQADDLIKMINSSKFSEEMNREFDNLFDAAFLDIYPDFINDVNHLLRPDEQITLKDDNKLTPELRIYAFVHMGIDESTKIAQILNYSVSTVYAYRNRLRNKAKDRDGFDAAISPSKSGPVAE
ncbi:MAG: hypothetical protein K2H86_07915 [Muribaculaceae bacterium]|nr:hypothetical protein [Muribaculaceae bacterium]